MSRSGAGDGRSVEGESSPARAAGGDQADSLRPDPRSGHSDKADIFVCRYGIDRDFVKLLDFGIVKDPAADAAGSVTAVRVIAGTPGYMPSEMALGSPNVDWRSDIYALGCVGS